MKIGGKRIRVRFSRLSSTGNSQQQPVSNLYVKPLDPSITSQTLFSLFAKYGELDDAKGYISSICICLFFL
jgi:RNA recognition motif-containing protein